jgi:hypothetical protein
MSLYAPDQTQPLASATDVAALIRNHLRRRPAPALPRGDRALLRLAAAIVVLGLAAPGSPCSPPAPTPTPAPICRRRGSARSCWRFRRT